MAGKSSIAIQIRLVVMAVLSLSLTGCGEPLAPAQKRGLSDWLVECSPFYDYAGGRMLDFAGYGDVAVERGDNPKAWAPGPARITAKWTGEEAGQVMELILPGKPPARYALELPANGHTCILAPQPSLMLDQRTAWFGSLKKPDDDDDDDP